jgi:dTDP-glucose pyrophosphorylase
MGFTGVILAAGEGRRMGALGAHRPKACLPVCNRPLIHHHLDLFRGMGIEDVIVVVGFQSADVVAAVGRYPQNGPSVRFIEQPERRGIAHALALTRPHVTGAVAVILGDTYFVPGDLGAAIEMLGGAHAADLAAVLSVRTEPDPELVRRECTVRFDEAGRLVRIQEKPARPWNDLKPCGLYFFTGAIFDAIARTPASTLRGEVEITDSIQTLVDLGLGVGRAATVRWDSNVTVPEDLLLCNLVDLRRRGRDSLLGAGVRVHPDALLRDVVVGDRARVDVPARLEACLVMEGVPVREAASHRGCIFSEEELVRVQPLEPLPALALEAECPPGRFPS